MGNIEKAIGVTKYFVSLPQLRFILLGIVLLGFIFGLIINSNRYSGLELIIKGMLDGTMLLTLPAFLSAISVKALIKKVPFRRIAATTLAGEFLYASAYAAGYIITVANSAYANYGQLVVIVGTALIFGLWFVIGRLVFILKYRSFLFAVMQLFFHTVFLLSSPLIYFGEQPLVSVAKFYLSSFIVFAALFVFFFIINAPMRRSFGMSGTDAISFLVAQWLYKEKGLEDALAKMGQEAKTYLTLMIFERDNRTIFFVTPCVHFGPFGNLGGSEFSYLIAKELEKKHENSKAFVFHGTATHDLNPISTKELKKIIETCERGIKNATFKYATVGFATDSFEECRAEIININDSVFVGLTRAPFVTEDINFGLGMALTSEAEKKRSVVMLADQHNSETGEITSFEPMDVVGYNYRMAISKALDKKAHIMPLKIGVSHREMDTPVIGKAGIKVAIFSSDYAMVVIDANGITPILREKIIEEAKKTANIYGKKLEVGVFTTDTHQINVVKGVLNPLKEEDEVLKEINAGIAEAIFDMQPARFYASKEWFDIFVLGSKQSIEMVSTVNATLAVAKIIAPLLLLATIVTILVVMGKIGF